MLPSVWLLRSPGPTVYTDLPVPGLLQPDGDELCPSVSRGPVPARELLVRAGVRKMTGVVKISFKDCMVNTAGARNPNVFGFRMVGRVPFMVPTIQKQNEKMTVRLDRFNLKQNIFFEYKTV